MKIINITAIIKGGYYLGYWNTDKGDDKHLALFKVVDCSMMEEKRYKVLVHAFDEGVMGDPMDSWGKNFIKSTNWSLNYTSENFSLYELTDDEVMVHVLMEVV